MRILARNVRCAGGEIDLVALDGSTLVFVEVKSRTQASLVEGFDRIDGKKRRALRKACLGYLRSTAGPVEHFRVDGVAVDLEWRMFGLRVLDIRWERGLFSLVDEDEAS